MRNTMSSLIGQSAAFKNVLALIERIALCDAPVLIQGETGTGKELAARAIHYLGPRRNAPFVPLNCGAVPEALIESELFGCERGAYTDAHSARQGLVAAAEGGTLFLDELDALPPRAQISLLRFLQDQTYRPLGGTRERSGNIRVVAAASPRMASLIESGVFRTDLAFRINVLELNLPPLRERPGDPCLLADHFVRLYAGRYDQTGRGLDKACTDWLESYHWPGNVRELDNLVHRALLLSDTPSIWLGPRAPLNRREANPNSLALGYHEARDQAMHSWERQYLQALMHAAGGNVTRAAALAGKERRSLGKLLKRHGLGRVISDPSGSGETRRACLSSSPLSPSCHFPVPTGFPAV